MTAIWRQLPLKITGANERPRVRSETVYLKTVESIIYWYFDHYQHMTRNADNYEKFEDYFTSQSREWPDQTEYVRNIIFYEETDSTTQVPN